MTKSLILSLFSLFLFSKGLSQGTENLFGIKFSGFVKTDIFYDTRQSTASTGLREGHFFLYPDNILNDNNGNDLNANPSFHMLNIQTRLRGDIWGPNAFGAKTSGAIEAEFFGTSEADLNGFRLRHAFLKLDWTKISLLAGQTWHPLFPAESFPGTISFNTGAPFVPFSRNPQVRLSVQAGHTLLQMTAYSQRDFTSAGIDGSSNRYLRNSGIPGLNLQLKVPANNLFTIWGGADYKKLRPEIKTQTNFETNSTISSIVLFSNIRIKTNPVTISMMGTYAQNGTDLMMLGGYAVTEITDVINQHKEYTTLNSASMWIDLSTNGNKISFGLFSGYSSNLGASEEINGSVYSRGSNIASLLRVSPRITFTSGKISFASEIETTSAAYGTMQNNGKVTDTKNVTNVRILLAAYCRF